MHIPFKECKVMPYDAKHFDTTLNIKSLDSSGRFAGYASVFDVVDSQKDVVLRGAFAQTLRGRISEVKLLWQHQMSEPIGTFDVIFEDERGLYVEGNLLLSVARANEAYALLKAGAVRGLSIGYSPVHYRYDPDSGARLIESVDLWEISLVTFPANASAQVTVVKHATPAMDENEEWLKQAKQGGQLIALADSLARAEHALRG